MKLTSISIKNFKGIDEHGITIEIAPITLLFGPNNAGKSTVIQALHLAREVFCANTPDFDKIESLNIGKFQDYVHKHDLDRSVVIKLECEELFNKEKLIKKELEEEKQKIKKKLLELKKGNLDDLSNMKLDIELQNIEITNSLNTLAKTIQECEDVRNKEINTAVIEFYDIILSSLYTQFHEMEHLKKYLMELFQRIEKETLKFMENASSYVEIMPNVSSIKNCKAKEIKQLFKKITDELDDVYKKITDDLREYILKYKIFIEEMIERIENYILVASQEFIKHNQYILENTKFIESIATDCTNSKVNDKDFFLNTLHGALESRSMDDLLHEFEHVKNDVECMLNNTKASAQVTIDEVTTKIKIVKKTLFQLVTNEIIFLFLKHVTCCAIEFEIKWDARLNRALLSQYSIFLNQKKLTTVKFNIITDESQVLATANFFSLEACMNADIYEELKAYVKNYEIDNHKKEEILPHLHEIISSKIELPIAEFCKINHFIRENNPKIAKLVDENDFEYGQTISFDVSLNTIWKSNTLYNWSGQSDDDDKEDFSLSYVFTFIAYNLDKILGQMLYMSPIRERIDRGAFLPQTFSSERWVNGLAVWDLITQSNNTSNLEKMNAIMHQLGLDYNIILEKIFLLENRIELREQLLNLAENNFDLQDILDQHSDVIIKLENTKTGVQTEIKDMGLGISQIMPILGAGVFAKEGTFIAIEEPESHIHPKLQVNLGDVIIESALNSENKPMYLIETHSEHLLLRFLRRIRHTNEGIAEDHLKITPNDIAVNWIGDTPTCFDVDGTEKNTYAAQLGIDEDGSFNTPWPEGFFDERGQELFE